MILSDLNACKCEVAGLADPGLGTIVDLGRFKNVWFREGSGKDTLGMFPDFRDRFRVALGLSQRFDGLRGDAAAAPYVGQEDAMSGELNQALDHAAWAFEWDSSFGRSEGRQGELVRGLAQANNAVDRYITFMNGALQSIEAAIAARGEAAKQEAARKASAAQAAAATAQAESFEAQAEALKRTRAAVTGTIAARKAEAPKIFGMSFGTAAVIGAAGLGALLFFMRRRA